MARAKKSPAAKPSEAETSSSRKFRSKGPLNPSEIEITVFAGVKDGDLADTPAAFSTKMKDVQTLLSDNPAFTDSVPHKEFIRIEEESTARRQLLELHFNRGQTKHSHRNAIVAGSLPVLEAALTDAFKIILIGEGSDPEIPAFLSDWKAGKVDHRSSLPSITLTRI